MSYLRIAPDVHPFKLPSPEPLGLLLQGFGIGGGSNSRRSKGSDESDIEKYDALPGDKQSLEFAKMQNDIIFQRARRNIQNKAIADESGDFTTYLRGDGQTEYMEALSQYENNKVVLDSQKGIAKNNLTQYGQIKNELRDKVQEWDNIYDFEGNMGLVIPTKSMGVIQLNTVAELFHYMENKSIDDPMPNYSHPDLQAPYNLWEGIMEGVSKDTYSTETTQVQSYPNAQLLGQGMYHPDAIYSIGQTTTDKREDQYYGGKKVQQAWNNFTNEVNSNPEMRRAFMAKKNEAAKYGIGEEEFIKYFTEGQIDTRIAEKRTISTAPITEKGFGPGNEAKTNYWMELKYNPVALAGYKIGKESFTSLETLRGVKVAGEDLLKSDEYKTLVGIDKNGNHVPGMSYFNKLFEGGTINIPEFIQFTDEGGNVISQGNPVVQRLRDKGFNDEQIYAWHEDVLTAYSEQVKAVEEAHGHMYLSNGGTAESDRAIKKYMATIQRDISTLAAISLMPDQDKTRLLYNDNVALLTDKRNRLLKEAVSKGAVQIFPEYERMRNPNKQNSFANNELGREYRQKVREVEDQLLVAQGLKKDADVLRNFDLDSRIMIINNSDVFAIGPEDKSILDGQSLTELFGNKGEVLFAGNYIPIENLTHTSTASFWGSTFGNAVNKPVYVHKIIRTYDKMPYKQGVAPGVLAKVIIPKEAILNLEIDVISPDVSKGLEKVDFRSIMRDNELLKQYNIETMQITGAPGQKKGDRSLIYPGYKVGDDVAVLSVNISHSLIEADIIMNKKDKGVFDYKQGSMYQQYMRQAEGYEQVR